MKKEISMKKELKEMIAFVAAGSILTFALFLGWIFIMANIKVYTSRLSGQAALAHSESARQVLVSQAKAELESAKLRAEAIQIVGEMAKKFPEYREQEFIGAFGEALKSDRIEQIIYVPTEANIPIIERKR